MINKLLKWIVDLLYRTSKARNRFERNNPGHKVLIADASKGIVTSVNQDIQRGMDWVTSQRAVIMLTDQHIVCGQWIIPLETISKAQLFKINSLVGGGQVLKVETTDNENYQFGMQFNPEWLEQQQLPLTLESGQVTNSPFSILVRLIAFGYLVYLILNYFFDS